MIKKRVTILICMIVMGAFVIGCSQGAPKKPKDAPVEKTPNLEQAGQDKGSIETGDPNEPPKQKPSHYAQGEPETIKYTGEPIKELPEVTDPEALNAELVLSLYEKLGLDRSKLKIAVQKETAKYPELWGYEVDIDGANGSLGKATVRTDLQIVESADVVLDSSVPASSPGSDYADITAKSLGLEDMGYARQPELSRESMDVYRKFVPFGEFQVSVGVFLIRWDPASRKLAGVNRFEDPPLQEFKMSITREEAPLVLAEYLEVKSVTPDRLTLVQMQSGASRSKDTFIYWEVHSSEGYLYVRTDTGEVVESPVGREHPIGF